MIWYSHHFKNIPQFVVIYIVKDFLVANDKKVDFFLEFPCFLYDPVSVVNMISGSSAFLNPGFTWIQVLLKPSL